MIHDPPYLYASTWWCGDEVCNCTEPQIELVLSRPPWPARIRLWAGSFHSDADPDELAEQARELAEAAKRFGIPWDADTVDAVHGLSWVEAERLVVEHGTADALATLRRHGCPVDPDPIVDGLRAMRDDRDGCGPAELGGRLLVPPEHVADYQRRGLGDMVLATTRLPEGDDDGD